MLEKIFSWILDIMLMLFSVLFLTFCILASYNYKFNTHLIQPYKENWETGPILEITSTSTTCPQGYQNFISNTFPGNSAGCDCSTTSELPYKGKIYNNNCDSYQIANNCKMIFMSKDIALNTWKGTKLCVLRMNKNFWQLTATNVNCADGMKKCGELDGFANTLCVLPNEKCPINDVIISNEAVNGYTKVKLNDGYSLYYTNQKADGQIIVEIQARQSDVCVTPYEGDLGENDYTLNNDKGPGRCSTQINNNLIDTRFKKFDSVSYKEFYDENNISKYISKLPLYPLPPSDSTISIFKINYFGWNKKCFNDNTFQPDNIVTPQHTVDFNSNRAFFLAIWSGIHFFFILVSIVLYKIFFEKMRISMTIVFTIDVINVIFLIIFISYAIVIQKGTNQILNPYTMFIDNKCGDLITNDIMEESFGGIKNVKGYILPILVLAIIETIYIFSYYTWMYVIKSEQFR